MCGFEGRLWIRVTSFHPLASVCVRSCFFPTVHFGISVVLVSQDSFSAVHTYSYHPSSECISQPSVFVPSVQLSVFIYYAVWKPQKQWVTLDKGIWNSPLTYQPDMRQEAWRFISYMFVHAGWASEPSANYRKRRQLAQTFIRAASSVLQAAATDPLWFPLTLFMNLTVYTSVKTLKITRPSAMGTLGRPTSGTLKL